MTHFVMKYTVSSLKKKKKKKVIKKKYLLYMKKEKKRSMKEIEIVQLGNGRTKLCNLVLALNDMIKYSLFHRTLCLQCTAQMV